VMQDRVDLHSRHYTNRAPAVNTCRSRWLTCIIRRMAVCLVTGVAGFIGSTLAERLLAEGHEVLGVDCFTPYYARAIKQQNLSGCLAYPKFTFAEKDLAADDLGPLVEGVQFV